MANLKYNEKTKIVSFRIPESRIADIKKLVNKALLDIKREKLEQVPVNKTQCDCFIDEQGIFRRGKIKCSKPKSEHKL